MRPILKRSVQFFFLAAVVAAGFVPVAQAQFAITTGSPLPSGTTGVFYSTTIQATSPVNWTATGIPAGLALSNVTGTNTTTLSGTPTVSCVCSVTVTADGTVHKVYSLTIVSTTTLTSSLVSPSLFGKPLTLTATVTPSAATGKVTFYNGTTVLGTSTLNAAGQATLTTSLLPVGSNKLKAFYAGDGTNTASTSAVRTQVVNSLPQTGFFVPATTYATGAGTSNATFAVTGDFNGDGKADVAVANFFSPNVSIFLGTGAGTFAAPNVVSVGAIQPGSIAVGDFNGDGKSDIVVADFANNGNTIVVLLGDGAGGFGAPVSYTIAPGAIARPSAVAVGDVDGDGKADLVVTDWSLGSVSILLGTGAGTFNSPTTISIGANTSPNSLVIGDFNSDGIPDIATANQGTANISVLLGAGSGRFAAPVNYSAGTGASSTIAIAAGDFDGDGNLDLAVANYASSTVGVLLGSAQGTFGAASVLNTDTNPIYIAVGDFDGNGKLDLVTANFGGNDVSVLLGDGTGGFGAQQPYSAGPGNQGTSGIAVADFNSDGISDLFLANYGSSDASSLFGLARTSTDVGLAPATIQFTTTTNLSATVTSSTGATPTGTVTFLDNGIQILSPATLDASGVATLNNVASGSVGNHPISAVYSGDSANAASTSATALLTVTKDNTNTALTTAPSPTTPSQNVVLTATVTPQAGVNVPQGTVQFRDNGVNIGNPQTVSGGGIATLNLSFAVGSHPLTAVYSGDANDNASTSATFTESSQSPTTTVLTSSANPSASGAGVTFTATVTPGTATGTVTFNDNGTAIGTGDLNANGLATFTTATLGVGSHPITASYPGDADDQASNSNTVAQVVKTASTTTLSIAPNGTAVFGAPVTLTATVTGSVAGQVTFYNGAAVLGTSPISGGTATLTTSFLPAGLNKLRAFFPGDANVISSASAVQQETITANATSGFTPGSTFIGGLSGPWSLVATDFNNDGKPDLFVANTNGGSGGGGFVSVIFSDGHGDFASRPAVSAGSNPQNVAVGDFNGDGQTDIAVVDPVGGALNIVLADGSGGFSPAVSYTAATGLNPFALVVADFDGDGNADVAVANQGSNNITVFFGTGTGTLGSGVPYPAGTQPSGIAAGDFNGDGFTDLAVSNFTDNTISILLNGGSGVFSAGTPVPTGGSHPEMVAVGDFDGDGKLDLAAPNAGTNNVAVMLGNGNGTFGAASNTNVGGGPAFVAFGDFDGDGRIDIVASNSSSNDVTVLYGNGSGGVASTTTFPLPPGDTSPAGITVADFNGDGATDIAVTNFTSNSVTLLSGIRNTSTVLTSSVNPSLFGQSTTLTATISPTGAASGNVTFFDGNTPVGTSALVADSATLNVATLSTGAHSLHAVYNGDAANNASTSLNLSQTVSSLSTTTSLTAAPSPATQGTNVTLTATVTPTVGNTIPGGTVTFQDAGNVIAAGAALNASGVATFTTSTLSTGSHSLTAVYSGDVNDTASTSAAFTETILTPTTTALTSSRNPATVGQTITFDVQITPGGGTGTITLKDAGTIIGGPVAPDPNGFASFRVLFFIAGAHPLTATYSGDTAFATSQGALNLNVVPATTTTLSAPATAYFGQPLSLTATVVPAAAAGTVMFFDGAKIVGAAPLVGGAATLSTPLIGPGARKLRAVYQGSASFGSSSSAYLAKTISVRAQTGFGSGTLYSTGPSTVTSVVGDFNLDGKQDIAVLDQGGSSSVVTILLGNGDGTFTAKPPINAGNFADDLAVGDFNNDGKPDVAVADDSDGLLILTGDGTGGFTAGSPQSLGDNQVIALAVSDYNSDGIADVIFGRGGGAFYAQGVGDGTFLAPVQLTAEDDTPIPAAVDMNSDGNVDLVTLSGSSVVVLLGNGDGTFQPPNPYPLNSPTSIAVADLSGDGKPDVVAGSNTGAVYFLPGNGDGTLGASVTITVGFAPESVAVGDFNGDGIPDIGAGDVADGNIYVVPGLGNGNFGPPVGIPTSFSPVGLTIGDFSGGTGRSDIAFIPATDDIVVLLGLPPNVLLTCPVGGAPVVQGTAYSLPCAGSNGVAPYTYSVPAGTLPPGLTLNTSTGLISGTPTQAGPFPFTVEAVDSDVPAESLTVNVTLNVQPPLILAPSPLPAGTVNTNYSAAIVSGGTTPYTCGRTAGAFPPGLVFDTAACVLSGTPTTPGLFSFTISASDSGAPPQNVSQAYTLTIQQITTTTTLTSSVNPSTIGSATTLNAFVTPVSAGGTITFNDAGTPLGNPVALTRGTASLDISTLSAGPHSLTAAYSGDANDAASVSNTVNQLVRVVPAVTLSAVPNTSVFGTTVSLTANVGGTPAPTGRVTFYDGTTILGDNQLAASAASITTALLTSGTRSLFAIYQGDNTYAVGKSFVHAFTVSTFPQNGLGPATHITIGPNTFAVAVSDFNGDGIADLATSTTNGSTAQIAIQFGNGNGTFANPVYYDSGTPALAIAAADVNNDNLPDLILATPGSNGVTILLNTGGGVFGAPVVFGTGGAPISIAVADFNGDGIPDIVAGNTGFVDVLVGTGAGTFQLQPPNFAEPTSGNTYVTAADFNGDGNADVAAVDASGTVLVLLGAGNGLFQAASYSAGVTPLSIASADVNHDGYPDVVIGNSGSSVMVMSGSATGVLGPAVGYPAGTVSGAVAIGDFNGDGLLDIAVGDLSAARISVLAGNVNGTFQPKVDYPTAGIPFAIASGNFKGGGGRTDLVAADGPNADLDVLLGQIPQPSITCTPGAPPVLTGAPYTITCPASGGVAPYTYSISAGNVPTGLTLDTNTGTISGTAVAATTFNFTVKAVDSDTPAQNATASLSVTVVTPLTMPATPLPAGTVNTAYTVTLATGGTPPYTCGLSAGALPSGLTLNAATCLLSGTPTAAGVFPFTIGVSDNGSPQQNNSRAFSLTIQQTTTTTGLTTSLTPSAFNSPITLTAIVTPAGATGNVTFNDGPNNPLGTVTLNNGGVATLNIATLSVGSHTLTAVYAGDANDLGSLSGQLTQVVNKATTTTTLTSSANPVQFGQRLTLRAAVSPGGATGTVTFSDGGQPLGSVSPDANGVAQINESTLSVGAHSLTASYSGDANYDASLSNTLPQNISLGVTTTILSSSLNPSLPGQAVTFTATVQPAGATGTVTFSDGGNPVASMVALNGGVGAFTISTLAPGAHTVTASYSGDSNYAASVSSLIRNPLNFSAATPGTLADSAGQGTGFTTRLPGTGGTFTGNDPNLTLNTAAGTLGLVSTAADLDGQVSMGVAEFPGLPLSSVGVTNNEDFSVIATFNNWQYSQSIDQLGVFVGSSSTTAFRGGGLVFAPTPFAFTVQTVNGVDVNLQDSAGLAPAAGDNVALTLSRTSGTWSMSIQDQTNPAITGNIAVTQPAYLNGVPNLIGGIFAGSPGASPKNETVAAFALAGPVQTVGDFPSTTILTSSANPSIAGNSITLTATVTPAAATGTVTFQDDGVTIGTGDLNNGTASLNIATLAFGSHPLTAVYSGDATTAPGTSPVLNQVVNFTGLTITTTSLPVGTAGTAYAAVTLQAGGGSGNFTWSATGLPAGMTLTPAGVLSGSAAAGSSPIEFTVTDNLSQLTASQTLTLTINAAPPPPVTQAPPLVISGPADLGSTTPGGALSGSFAASGGTPPYSFSIAGGDASFAVDANGHLTGSPTGVGNSSVTVKVTDSKSVSQQASATYSVFGFTTGSLPSGSVSVNYSAGISVAGGTGPYTFFGTGIPPGLSFSAGTLSGKPTTAGSYSLTVQASDARGLSATRGFAISIAPAPPPVQNPGPLQITTSSLANGTAGQPYSQTLGATGGSPGYTWSQTGGALPAGLSLDPSGTVTGLPSAPGPYSFGVQVADTAGGKVAAAVSLNIQPAPLEITTGSTLPTGTVNVEYPSQTLTASGGVAPYTFSVTGSLPDGLSLVNGQISGTPTTASNAGFTLKVTDSAQPANTATLVVSITIRPNGTADLTLSAAALSFSLVAGSTATPDGSTVTVSSTDVASTLNFTAAVASAPWLNVGASPATPGSITIGLSNAALALTAAGSPYTATVVVTCNTDPCTSKSQLIGITLTVTEAPPELSVDSSLLSFVAQASNPQSSSATLGVRNAGGGSLKVNGISASDPWIVVGAFPTTLAAGPGTNVSITVNPGPLAAGFYLGSVNVDTGAGSASIPVSLLISADSTMTLGPAGGQFSMPQGGALGNSNGSFLVSVSKASAVTFSATVLPGAPWLHSGTGGTSSSSSPGTVSYSIDSSVSTLAAGAYYGTIRVAAAGIVNTPLDFQVVVNIAPASTPVTPNPQPAGLLFLSSTPGPQAPQLIQVYASSVAPLSYQASASMSDGSGWLSIDSNSGSAAAGKPGSVQVLVNSTGLKPGAYRGTVSFASGSTVVSVNVTLVVEPATPGADASAIPVTRAKPADAGPICAGATLVATQTGLVDNFAAPASWPTPLAIKLVDTCGSIVGSGQLVATFSNGDPPLELAPVDVANGIYSGTWTPRNTASQITITAHATVPGYPAASVQIAGKVTPNTAPQLAPNGTFDVFHPQVGAGLGPGNIVQIYGTSLASQTTAPQILPLPTEVQGTQVLIGGVASPLFYVSPGQVNAQIPFELEAGKQYQVIVSANGALTTPQPIQLNAGAPAVLQFTSGLIVAQHQDGTLVSGTSPAAPGEFIVLYMSGLGATDITVPSGQPSPSDPPARVLDTPVLTMNGTAVPLSFAGLTPSLVGLYQINLQIPAGLADGSYDVVVSQSGVVSNTTSLPVKN